MNEIFDLRISEPKLKVLNPFFSSVMQLSNVSSLKSNHKCTLPPQVPLLHHKKMRIHMKKLLLPILFFALSISLRAQIVTDSVQLGAGYTSQVFYQLAAQTKTSVPFAGPGGWDIGFQTTLMNASIISDENTIQVYKVPNADSIDYPTLDVSGYSSWTQLYNSDTSWNLGAFNTGESGYNFGWGIYDPNLYQVFGDSLFVLVKGSDVYKFWIRRKSSAGDYIIRYANVTAGGSDVNLTIPALSYLSKNFVYLDLDNPSPLDLEPASSDWDILFTHYLTDLPYVGQYPVTGVFSNTGVTVAKAFPVDVNTVSYTNYLSDFSTNLTAIGYDWKYFDMIYFQYVIEDSLVYFIKAKDNVIYSLRFTAFNNTDGVITFETEQLFTGINEVSGNLSEAAIYPNPSGTETTIVYDAKANDKVNALLFDISGREVMKTSFEAHQGLNHETLSLPDLNSGIYHLVLDSRGQKINLKVMVAR